MPVLDSGDLGLADAVSLRQVGLLCRRCADLADALISEFCIRPSSDVLSPSHRLKVFRIDACGLVAKVIQLITSRHWTPMSLEIEPVGELHGRVFPDLAIAPSDL